MVTSWNSPRGNVGGGSERTFERLAEYGSAWLTNAVPPKEFGEQIDRMRQVTGTKTPVAVFGTTHDRETLDIYADLGVDRVLLNLPTLPRDEALHALDELAEATVPYRSADGGI